MKKYNYVCSVCGSDDVVRDAYAGWNENKQRWYLCYVKELQGYCNNCKMNVLINEVKLIDKGEEL